VDGGREALNPGGPAPFIYLMSMIVLLFLAPFQAQEEEWHPPGMLYLLRHQGKDGSWGETPRTCRCADLLRPPPPGLKADEATSRRVSNLIRELGEDRVEARDRARQDLIEAGRGAIPQLWESLRHRDPEIAGRCREILLEFQRGEAPREGDAATTGLAIFSIMAWGYSHLSKDTYGGICVGDALRGGIKWLQARQDTGGAFSKDPAENAIAALALMEAYGLTGSNLFKDSAIKGCVSVWQTKSEDATFLAWKGLALNSWVMSVNPSEAPPAPRYCDISEALSRHQGDLARAGAILFNLFDRRGGGGPDLDRMCSLNWQGIDPLTFYLASWAVRESNDSKRWKDWRERMKDALLWGREGDPWRCEHDSWGAEGMRGRSRLTAMRSLTSYLLVQRHCIFHGKP